MSIQRAELNVRPADAPSFDDDIRFVGKRAIKEPANGFMVDITFVADSYEDVRDLIVATDPGSKLLLGECSACGFRNDFVKCDFANCRQKAEYEGWYRTIDHAGVPTGLNRRMRVCKDCVKYLIGWQDNVLQEGGK